jgi:nitrite transporter NirC
MIMGVGALSGRTDWGDLGRVWTYSWVGNLFGSVLVAAMAVYGGVFADSSLVVDVAANKMTLSPLELFIQAVFCNWLVVLAVWCNFRLENAVAKLVMVWWCLLAFIGAGFEHSVANMTVLTLANLLPHSTAAVSWSGWLYNISIVTAGNAFAGVVMMGGAYWYISESYKLELPSGSTSVSTFSSADDD